MLFCSLDNRGGGDAFAIVLASVESTVEEMLVVTTIFSDSSLLGSMWVSFVSDAGEIVDCEVGTVLPWFGKLASSSLHLI